MGRIDNMNEMYNNKKFFFILGFWGFGVLGFCWLITIVVINVDKSSFFLVSLNQSHTICCMVKKA